MPVAFSAACHVVKQKAEAAVKEVSGCSVLKVRRRARSQESLGQREQRDITEW